MQCSVKYSEVLQILFLLQFSQAGLNQYYFQGLFINETVGLCKNPGVGGGKNQGVSSANT